MNREADKAGDLEKRVAAAIHRAMPGREDSPALCTPVSLLLARVAIAAIRETSAKASDDLVNELRAGVIIAQNGNVTKWRPKTLMQAADEIERLRVQIAAAEAQIERWHRVAMEAGAVTCVGGGHIYPLKDKFAAAESTLETAKKALEPFARLAEHVNSQLHEYSDESEWEVKMGRLREAERIYETLQSDGGK